MKSFCILISLCILGACNFSQRHNQEEEKELQQRLLKVHDRIMPQMGALEHQEMAVKALVSNLKVEKKANAAMDTLAASASLQADLESLETADGAMMNWMDKMNLDFNGKTHKQIMEYLGLQYTEVKQIDSMVQKAMDESVRLTGKPVIK